MKVFLFTLLAFFLTACTFDHGRYTVLSNQIINTDDLDLETPHKTRNVDGESAEYTLLGIPFGEVGGFRIESAMDEAFKVSDGDLLTNAYIKEHLFILIHPLIFSRHSFEVGGDVIKTRK